MSYVTMLFFDVGKNYQELRVQKRERKQPSTIPDLPYLHWERTGHAPAGPYSVRIHSYKSVFTQLQKCVYTATKVCMLWFYDFWQYFCLFVCLDFIVPLENFSLIWRGHHYRWRAVNFDLCSALMAIEQWGFFSLPHLLWHGPTVYNDHLWGPVTLAPFAEPLAVELSLPVLFLWLRSVETRDWTLISCMRGEPYTSTPPVISGSTCMTWIVIGIIPLYTVMS